MGTCGEEGSGSYDWGTRRRRQPVARMGAAARSLEVVAVARYYAVAGVEIMERVLTM